LKYHNDLSPRKLEREREGQFFLNESYSHLKSEAIYKIFMEIIFGENRGSPKMNKNTKDLILLGNTK
jgi:hypothetical protein